VALHSDGSAGCPDHRTGSEWSGVVVQCEGIDEGVSSHLAKQPKQNRTIMQV